MMERTRVIEIIEVYGGDPARWPDGEREAARALLSTDLPLRRLADEAAGLDALLGGWSRGGPADDENAARGMADAALAAAERPTRRWLPASLFGGAAVAAAIAGAVILGPAATEQPMATPTAAPQQQAIASTDAMDTHLWSMTFTPTPEEESLI